MKKLLNTFVFLFLLMIGATACTDSLDEYLDTEGKGFVETRSENLGATDYYWSEGEKIAIKRSEDKSFVLFRSSDREMLMSSFSKKGIYINASKIQKYGYGGTDNSGDATKSFIDCEWAEVDVNAKVVYDVPEIVYVAPYYCGPDEDTFPLTNLVYVHLKNVEDITLLEKLAKENNVGIIGKLPEMPLWYVISCTKESTGNALEIANLFCESKLFGGVEPAFISRRLCTNDYYYPQQWNLENTGQFGSVYSGYDIKYSNAFSLIPSLSYVTVAIVDAGVQLAHTDLSVHSFSWDAATNSSPSLIQSNGYLHGTNVAGVISAKTNNSIGVAGIAYSVKSMSLSNRFGDSTADAQLASSIRKAVDQGASVINNSWSGGTNSQVINEAIDYAVKSGRNGKGCVVVFSSGNNNKSIVNYPASYYPDTDVIAVGAISYNGKRKDPKSPDGDSSWGSNYGFALDVVAPGVRIPTTALGNSWITDFWGTSAATPHVSAVAALILTINPNLTYQEVAYIIGRSAQKLPGYTYNASKMAGTWNSEVGYGLLNVYAALTAANATNNPSGNLSMSGLYTVYANGNGYAGTTINVFPSSANYTYFWSASFSGECDRWFIWPNDNGNGPSADISVYLNSGQTGGMVAVNCRVYSGATYLGAVSHYLSVIP